MFLIWVGCFWYKYFLTFNFYIMAVVSPHEGEGCPEHISAIFDAMETEAREELMRELTGLVEELPDISSGNATHTYTFRLYRVQHLMGLLETDRQQIFDAFGLSIGRDSVQGARDAGGRELMPGQALQMIDSSRSKRLLCDAINDYRGERVCSVRD